MEIPIPQTTGEIIDTICGFCGNRDSSPKVDLTCSGSDRTQLASRKAAEAIRKAQESEILYWLRLCPACSLVVGIEPFKEGF